MIARGKGRFEAWLQEGERVPGVARIPRRHARGSRAGDAIEFEGAFRASLSNGQLELASGERLARVEEPGTAFPAATPPPGAISLFVAGRLGPMEGALDALGYLRVPARTHDAYQDFLLHLEFRTPFMPESRGQGRGNSGVYLQDRYEIQILDSFGNPPALDECGALYGQAAPDRAMAAPPLQWQYYDIEFRAARFDAHGKKNANAHVVVQHNGQTIHDRDITGPTGLGDPETPEPGPLSLQDHWSPVVFRNVWILPR